MQAELLTVQLDQLETIAKESPHQKIKTRGFLYQNQNGQLVLASQPNLKSCCVGIPSNVQRQLFIQGEIKGTLPTKVIEVEGILKVEPQYNAENQLVQLYVLEEAQIGQPADLSLLVWGLGLGFLLFVLYHFCFRRNK